MGYKIILYKKVKKIPIFNYKEIKINYEKKGKGIPLLLLSGWGMTIGSWEFVKNFFKRKMMVILLDNRGNGKSSKPNYPYSMEMFIDEIRALLNYLQIKEKIHVVGISMGGMTALNFALKYPEDVKSLILISTSAYPGEDFEFVFEELRRIKNELPPEIGFKKMLELSFSKKFLDRLSEDKMLYDALFDELYLKNDMSWQDYINQSAAIRDLDIRDSLKRIELPTLIIHGTADRELPFKHGELLHDNIRNSKLIPLEGLGHGGALITEYEKVNKEMWKFIQGNS